MNVNTQVNRPVWKDDKNDWISKEEEEEEEGGKRKRHGGMLIILVKECKIWDSVGWFEISVFLPLSLPTGCGQNDCFRIMCGVLSHHRLTLVTMISMRWWLVEDSVSFFLLCYISCGVWVKRYARGNIFCGSVSNVFGSIALGGRQGLGGALLKVPGTCHLLLYARVSLRGLRSWFLLSKGSMLCGGDKRRRNSGLSWKYACSTVDFVLPPHLFTFLPFSLSDRSREVFLFLAKGCLDDWCIQAVSGLAVSYRRGMF